METQTAVTTFNRLIQLAHGVIPESASVLIGNVEFWHDDHGMLCFDKPNNQWNVEHITRDLTSTIRRNRLVKQIAKA